MRFFNRKKDPVQPSGVNWCWTLTVNGRPSSDFDWPDLVRGLEDLRPDRDSFVALDRLNPEDPREAGFLQCTLSRDGTGYLLECGYPGPEGPVLLQRHAASLPEIIPAFGTVYRQKGPVFYGFSDLADALGRDQP